MSRAGNIAIFTLVLPATSQVILTIPSKRFIDSPPMGIRLKGGTSFGIIENTFWDTCCILLKII